MTTFNNHTHYMPAGTTGYDSTASPYATTGNAVPYVNGLNPRQISVVLEADEIVVGESKIDGKALGKMLEYMVKEFKEKHPEEFI